MFVLTVRRTFAIRACPASARFNAPSIRSPLAVPSRAPRHEICDSSRPPAGKSEDGLLGRTIQAVTRYPPFWLMWSRGCARILSPSLNASASLGTTVPLLAADVAVGAGIEGEHLRGDIMRAAAGPSSSGVRLRLTPRWRSDLRPAGWRRRWRLR